MAIRIYNQDVYETRLGMPTAAKNYRMNEIRVTNFDINTNNTTNAGDIAAYDMIALKVSRRDATPLSVKLSIGSPFGAALSANIGVTLCGLKSETQNDKSPAPFITNITAGMAAAPVNGHPTLLGGMFLTGAAHAYPGDGDLRTAAQTGYILDTVLSATAAVPNFNRSVYLTDILPRSIVISDSSGLKFTNKMRVPDAPVNLAGAGGRAIFNNVFVKTTSFTYDMILATAFTRPVSPAGAAQYTVVANDGWEDTGRLVDDDPAHHEIMNSSYRKMRSQDQAWVCLSFLNGITANNLNSLRISCELTEYESPSAGVTSGSDRYLVPSFAGV